MRLFEVYGRPSTIHFRRQLQTWAKLKCMLGENSANQKALHTARPCTSRTTRMKLWVDSKLVQCQLLDFRFRPQTTSWLFLKTKNSYKWNRNFMQFLFVNNLNTLVQYLVCECTLFNSQVSSSLQPSVFIARK